MVRWQVILSVDEANAILKLAGAELRDPRGQIRLMVRQELERLKLLPRESADAASGGEHGQAD